MTRWMVTVITLLSLSPGPCGVAIQRRNGGREEGGGRAWDRQRDREIVRVGEEGAMPGGRVDEILFQKPLPETRISEGGKILKKVNF